MYRLSFCCVYAAVESQILEMAMEFVTQLTEIKLFTYLTISQLCFVVWSHFHYIINNLFYKSRWPILAIKATSSIMVLIKLSISSQYFYLLKYTFLIFFFPLENFSPRSQSAYSPYSLFHVFRVSVKVVMIMYISNLVISNLHITHYSLCCFFFPKWLESSWEIPQINLHIYYTSKIPIFFCRN